MSDSSSTQPWYHLSNLVPQDLHDASRSALANTAIAHLPTASAGEQEAVLLTEQPFLGYLVLRVDEPDEQFQQAVTAVLGVAIPTAPLSSAQSAKARIYWVSPNEWQIVVEGDQTFAIEKSLRDSLNGHYALVNVSGGQTLIQLSGANAIKLLMKSVAYDVHISNFSIDKVVTTTFARTQVLMRRLAEDQFELIIRRSFADYIYDWLVQASLEFGPSWKVCC